MKNDLPPFNPADVRPMTSSASMESLEDGDVCEEDIKDDDF